MTHEEAFLQDVLEAPDEDAPRRIYADWLIDQASAEGPELAERGEFIHLQCTLARLAPGERPTELVQRERKLLGTNHREWGGLFLRLGCQSWEHRRGFVESVGLPAPAFLAHASALCHAAPLRHLKLSSAALVIAQVAASVYLARMTTLDLEDNELGDEELQALLASPYLGTVTTLLLWSNQIGDNGARALAHATALPRLARLDLSANAIGDEGTRALATSPLLARLALLDLQRNRIGDGGARALLAALPAATKGRLDLGKNSLSEKLEVAFRATFAGRALT